MAIQDIKERARGALHGHMGRPAFYFPTPTDLDVFVETKVRPHNKRGQIGDLPGTNLNYAEAIDRAERVVLWRADVPAPVRGALVVFSETEGYWLDSVDPPDGQTITSTVLKATTTELAGVPFPGMI